MKDRFSPGRLGDWTFFCDICGNKCWASETTLLTTYTGRGGLRTCPECTDPIDYGLVPYKIPSERPVPFAKDTTQSYDPKSIYQKYPTENYELWADWTLTPDQLLARTTNPSWDNSEGRVWGNSFSYAWGQGVTSQTNATFPGGADIDEYGNAAEGQTNPDGTVK